MFQCLKIRRHLVTVILRDVTLTQDSYNNFIDLQDKLHQNIGRRHSLVSIGTHDLDTIKGPFLYDARHHQKYSSNHLIEISSFH